MKKYFLAIISFCLVMVGSSQTKKIAFESHSGNVKDFTISLSNELFDNEESDFGQIDIPRYDLFPATINIGKLDSVIVISDNEILLIGKSYSRLFTATSDSADEYIGPYSQSYAFSWRKKTNPVASFKQEIKSNKSLEITPKTFFKGFDKTKKLPVVTKKQALLPAIINPGNNSPVDPQLIIMLGSILLLSLGGGWLSWRLYKPRLQPV